MPVEAAVQEFIAIPIDTLRPETVLAFDLYIQHRGGECVLYRAARMEFSELVRQRLVDSGVTTLKVPADQAAAYRAYCQENESSEAGPGAEPEPEPEPPPEAGLVDLVRNPSIPLDRRCEHVVAVSRQVIDSVFHDLGSPGLPQRVHAVAEAQASLLISEPQAYHSLVQQFKIDYELYTHMVHTAFYAMELSRSSGMDELDELADIGRAAMVHDVGKAEMAPNLVLKDSRSLTDVEWAEVMGHPERGVAMLREASWDDPLCLDVCANHHERCDGSGYPRGLAENQISVPARIVAIADAFDELTSLRTDRPEMSGFQALWMMKRELRGQFDEELVDRFVRLMTAPSLGG